MTGLEEESYMEQTAPAYGFGSAVLYTDSTSPPQHSTTNSVAHRDDGIVRKFSQPIDFDDHYDGRDSGNIDLDNMSDVDFGYESWKGSLF